MFAVVQTSVEISSTDGSLQLRALASQVLFPGFLKALGRHETEDEGAAEGEDEDEGTSSQKLSRQQEQDRQAQLLAGLQVLCCAVLCCAVLCLCCAPIASLY